MIAFKEVTKIYPMGSQQVRAMDGVSLEIDKGDFVALMGPSGSGKSTAMNIMGCLDRPDTGTYWLDGREVGALGERELAGVRNQMIGFVHQNFNLLPEFTAQENVELPLVYARVPGHERVERARRCLGAVGLEDWARHRPHQLSGGQQQRVAIARALVQDASLVLADEPTGNLDSVASVEIMMILSRLHQRGATVVVVTHDADIAEWASHTFYFRDGRLGE